MRATSRLVLAGTLLALAAAAPAARPSPNQREYAGTARILAALHPGPPVDCISLSRSNTSRFLDRDTIAYRETNARYYVNRTSGGCSFSDDTIVVSRTPSDRLCRGDILRLVDRGGRFPRGSCILGDFVPYKR